MGRQETGFPALILNARSLEVASRPAERVGQSNVYVHLSSR
jgi:hypothetical protein